MFNNIARTLSSTVKNGVKNSKNTKTYGYLEMSTMILAPVGSVLGAICCYNNYQMSLKRIELAELESMDKLDSLS